MLMVVVNLFCCCFVSSPPAGISQWGDGRLTCWQRQQGWRHVFPGYEPKCFSSQCLIVVCSWFVLNSLSFCCVSSVIRALPIHPSISVRDGFARVQKVVASWIWRRLWAAGSWFWSGEEKLSLSSWPRRGFVWFLWSFVATVILL